MQLLSIASSLPRQTFSQRDCLEAVKGSPYWESLKERSLRILAKVLLGDNGIAQRHFAVDSLEEAWKRDAQQLNESYEREAPRLGAHAVRAALDRAALKSGEVDVLLVSTCTGYLCPGLSSHIAEQLGLRPDVFTQDLTGHGCGAALPLVQIAAGYSRLYPEARIVTAEVEVCSAAFHLDNDVGVLISACLFGDAASAQVWTGSGGSHSIGSFKSVHRPLNREDLRFVNYQGRLKNRLRKSVPSLVADSVNGLWQSVVGETIGRVVLHGGGRDVLDALEPVFPGRSLASMRSVLRNCGNVSSPSVFLALERDMESGASAPGPIWLCGFGAGFSAHAGILEPV